MRGRSSRGRGPRRSGLRSVRGYPWAVSKGLALGERERLSPREVNVLDMFARPAWPLAHHRDAAERLLGLQQDPGVGPVLAGRADLAAEGGVVEPSSDRVVGDADGFA